MMKRRLCEATFTWKLSCEGPLLIADGRYQQGNLGRNPQGEKYPDKVFISRDPLGKVENAIRSSKPEALSLSFYVPGTSLRGPLRAQAERIVRSVLPPEATVPVTACDPFEEEKADWMSCSRRLDQKRAEVPYKAVCPACKLFGSTASASRLRLGDADVTGMESTGYLSVYRDMIGIDRFTGGVHSGALMRFHALERTAFETSVTVVNFELWHLGLLAHAFKDFEDGLVAIGFGKTKGFGQVTGEVPAASLTYPKGRSEGKLQDVASLSGEADVERYGFHHREAIPELELGQPEEVGYGLYERFEVKDVAALWTKAAAAFHEYTSSLGEAE